MSGGLHASVVRLNLTKCSVDGCEKDSIRRDLCNAHYLRLMRHGSPTAGSTDKGAVRKWLETTAIPYVGDECLAFPYSRDGHGYGRINLKGKFIGAHAFVLMATAGEKPSPRHEVCHTCGGGHLGCVNPRHLFWGTRTENVKDSIDRGTFRIPRNRDGVWQLESI